MGARDVLPLQRRRRPEVTSPSADVEATLVKFTLQ